MYVCICLFISQYSVSIHLKGGRNDNGVNATGNTTGILVFIKGAINVAKWLKRQSNHLMQKNNNF
jgi:hypothetical protein